MGEIIGEARIFGAKVAFGLVGTLLYFTILMNCVHNKKPSELEQKTQNEIIVDSARVDTTNYPDSFDYLGYNSN